MVAVRRCKQQQQQQLDNLTGRSDGGYSHISFVLRWYAFGTVAGVRDCHRGWDGQGVPRRLCLAVCQGRYVLYLPCACVYVLGPERAAREGWMDGVARGRAQHWVHFLGIGLEGRALGAPMAHS
jgi:hypothetical protein